MTAAAAASKHPKMTYLIETINRERVLGTKNWELVDEGNVTWHQSIVDYVHRFHLYSMAFADVAPEEGKSFRSNENGGVGFRCDAV